MIENKMLSPEEMEAIDQEQFKDNLEEIEHQNPDFAKKNRRELDQIAKESKKGNWRTVAFGLTALFSSYLINISKAEAGEKKFKELPKKPVIKQTVNRQREPMEEYMTPMVTTEPPSSSQHRNEPEPMEEYTKPMIDDTNKKNINNKNPMDEYSQPVPLPKK